MNSRKPGLFDSRPTMPEGFSYRADLLSPDEERELAARFADLPFREFEFHGYVGKRRVVSYGWRYDFNDGKLRRTEDIPEFLLSSRDKAAAFARLDPADLQHVLVTEYRPGAAIGWHRDKAVFAEVVGISLLSACTFRFRRKLGTRWERAAFVAEPCSAYLLDGPSRTEWEHGIAAVDRLRFSITFRSLRSP